MKLIYCRECGDIFKIIMEKLRTCECGTCMGIQLDERSGIFSGESAFPVEIDEDSLLYAIDSPVTRGEGNKFDAFTVPPENSECLNMEKVPDVFVELSGQKATLTFVLPKNKHEFLRTVHADDVAFALWNIDEYYLRSWIKYGNPFDSPDDAIKAVREHIREELRDRGIFLDDLVGP